MCLFIVKFAYKNWIWNLNQTNWRLSGCYVRIAAHDWCCWRSSLHSLGYWPSPLDLIIISCNSSWSFTNCIQFTNISLSVPNVKPICHPKYFQGVDLMKYFQWSEIFSNGWVSPNFPIRRSIELHPCCEVSSTTAPPPINHRQSSGSTAGETMKSFSPQIVLPINLPCFVQIYSDWSTY